MTDDTASDQPDARGRGYDAARSDRVEDHLNRWPFAQEIYRIASSGPRDWSVRIGVYGEWGSGKTSVINFVNSMAREDGHIIFTFNPWQFQTTDDLWKAFVEGLFQKIEEATQTKVPEARSRQVKAVAGTAAKMLPKILGLWKSEAADAFNGGIGLLRKYLVFSADDLAKLRDILGERRLIITIDDLDRTDAKLVPEILFALKEIMDVPGMAFICAFDPLIVGRVLGDSHAGFGDGLNFLEKIIDYPRWLPEVRRTPKFGPGAKL
jgi:predicted KAP-like P-loop ATPase